MSSFFTILLIGISLSMDAFSLSLIYGISIMNKKDKIFLSLIVGIYHFIMPLIGLNFGEIITNIRFLNINFLAAVILIYIGIDLIISNDKVDNSFNISILSFLVFGLSVSIDSLTVGIGLRAITNTYYLSSIIFSISSFTFTYLGLSFGNFIGNKVSGYSKKIGGMILILIAVCNLFKNW